LTHKASQSKNYLFFLFFILKEVSQIERKRQDTFTVSLSTLATRALLFFFLCVLLFPRWASKGAAVSVLPGAFISSLSDRRTKDNVWVSGTRIASSFKEALSALKMAALHFGGCISFTL
jgi:hypothetical protein